MAEQLSMHNADTVWLACVGLTSLLLEERNSVAQYTPPHPLINEPTPLIDEPHP